MFMKFKGGFFIENNFDLVVMRLNNKFKVYNVRFYFFNCMFVFILIIMFDLD